MEYDKKAKRFINKFKREHGIQGAASQVIIDLIAESLKAIDSAEEIMIQDGKKENAMLGKAGYGFIFSRLGDRKKHPGRDIIKDANKAIYDALKTLDVKPQKKPEEKKKEGGLKGMIASKGGKKVA